MPNLPDKWKPHRFWDNHLSLICSLQIWCEVRLVERCMTPPQAGCCSISFSFYGFQWFSWRGLSMFSCVTVGQELQHFYLGLRYFKRWVIKPSTLLGTNIFPCSGKRKIIFKSVVENMLISLEGTLVIWKSIDFCWHVAFLVLSARVSPVVRVAVATPRSSNTSRSPATSQRLRLVS